MNRPKILTANRFWSGGRIGEGRGPLVAGREDPAANSGVAVGQSGFTHGDGGCDQLGTGNLEKKFQLGECGRNVG